MYTTLNQEEMGVGQLLDYLQKLSCQLYVGNSKEKKITPKKSEDNFQLNSYHTPWSSRYIYSPLCHQKIKIINKFRNFTCTFLKPINWLSKATFILGIQFLNPV